MIFSVIKEFLQDLQEIEDEPDCLILDEDTLSENMRYLSFESHVTFIKPLLPPNAKPPAILSAYKLNIFSQPTKVAIAMVCQVLGYNYDMVVTFSLNVRFDTRVSC